MSIVESERHISTSSEDLNSAAVINLEPPSTLHTQEKNTSPEKSASDIVASVRESYNAGKTKLVSYRKQQLKNLLRLLEENSDRFIDAVKQDLGRPPMETCILDLNLCIYEVRRIIWNLEDWVRPEYPSKPFANILDTLYIIKEPYGVVLVIGSWNFPINLLLGPVAGAIAAGNCVVMKPSEVAVATERLMLELVPKYLDQECYRIFTGGPKETTHLLEQRFDYIFFTGSTSVGKIVHAAATKYLTPVTLELGGKNPVYLDETVDMERAAQRIFFGKCSNAGQICIAPDYLLCTREVQEKFIKAAQKVLKDWYGESAISSPHFCKIVSERHFQRLVSFIQDKGELAHGGRYDLNERSIEPTILTNVSLKEPIMQDEIFGPVLPIITVGNVKEAVAIINEREKPLVIYIFSNDKTTKKMLLNECSCGGVLVNDTLTHFVVDSLPFGGVGFSGMGHYHGKNTFDTFVHKKSVLDKGYSFILETGLSFRYPPYSNLKMKIIDLLSRPRTGVSASSIRTFMAFMAGILFAVIMSVLYWLIVNKS